MTTTMTMTMTMMGVKMIRRIRIVILIYNNSNKKVKKEKREQTCTSSFTVVCVHSENTCSDNSDNINDKHKFMWRVIMIIFDLLMVSIRFPREIWNPLGESKNCSCLKLFILFPGLDCKSIHHIMILVAERQVPLGPGDSLQEGFEVLTSRENASRRWFFGCPAGFFGSKCTPPKPGQQKYRMNGGLTISKMGVKMEILYDTMFSNDLGELRSCKLSLNR